MKSLCTLCLIILFSLWSTGCSPIKKPLPTPELPVLPDSNPAASLSYHSWWEEFDDPVLNNLIDDALLHNDSLALARANVKAARSAYHAVRTNLVPSVNAVGAAGRQKFSGEGSVPLAPGQNVITNNVNAGFIASYELDLFGKLTAERKLAKYTSKATDYELEIVRNIITSEVLKSYITLRALDESEMISQDALATADVLLALYDERRNVGLLSPVDYEALAAQREQIALLSPQFRAAREKVELALGTLVGRSPKELATFSLPRGKSIGGLYASSVPVPNALPSDLLEQRPDIKRAEFQLYAARANVNQARAKWFPLISLTGLYGAESTELTDLISNAAETWNLQGGITQPIIGLGKVKALVNQARAIRKQAEIGYQKTVREAYRDSLTALSNQRAEHEITERISSFALHQRAIYTLTSAKESTGRASLLDVYHVKLPYLVASINDYMQQASHLSSIIDLHHAIGGGWNKPKLP